MTVENLRITFNEAVDAEIVNGAQWYVNAHREAQRLATAFSLSIEQACGIIAVISPGMNWDENVPQTWEFCTTGALSFLPYGHLNEIKAKRIYGGAHPDEVLRGPKVTAFYKALLWPNGNTPAVVDRHVINAWHGYRLTGDEQKRIMRNKSKLTQIQADIAYLAGEYDIPIHACQAILWVVARSWVRARVVNQTLLDLR